MTDHIGNVIGDLHTRRGKILHVETKDQAEQITYAMMLRSLASERGSFAMKFARYDKVPHELAVQIIEAHKVEAHAAAH